MAFATVADAFNAYRGKTIEEIETRAQELKALVETDPAVDIGSMKIELEGLQQAKANIEEKESRSAVLGGLNIITGGQAGVKAHTGESVIDSPVYRSAFFKTMMGQTLTGVEQRAYAEGMQIAEKRADAFNGASNSGAIMPTATLNEIIRKARTIGGLLGECRQFAMPSSISIPVGAVGNKASWHVEGANVDSEKVDTTAVVFSANEIMKVISISAKVRKMSIQAFEAYIVDEITSAIAECLADSVVNGTGATGQGQGLEALTWTAGTNAVEIAAASDPTYKDVVELMAKLKRGYAKGAKFAMNNATLLRTFYGMVDAQKRPIFVQDAQRDGVGSILGYEVVVDDNIADGDVYFGNFAYLGVNIPEGVMVESSKDAGFTKGLYMYRGLAIADTRVILPEAFVKMYKKTTA